MIPSHLLSLCPLCELFRRRERLPDQQTRPHPLSQRSHLPYTERHPEYKLSKRTPRVLCISVIPVASGTFSVVFSVLWHPARKAVRKLLKRKGPTELLECGLHISRRHERTAREMIWNDSALQHEVVWACTLQCWHELVQFRRFLQPRPFLCLCPLDARAVLTNVAHGRRRLSHERFGSPSESGLGRSLSENVR